MPITISTISELINRKAKLELLMIGSAIIGEENWPKNKQAVNVPILFPLTSAGLSSKTQKLRLAINKPRPKPAKKTAIKIPSKVPMFPVRKYPAPIITNANRGKEREPLPDF